MKGKGSCQLKLSELHHMHMCADDQSHQLIIQNATERSKKWKEMGEMIYSVNKKEGEKRRQWYGQRRQEEVVLI